MALALAWAVPGFAQISFDASSTTGGAIRPGFATVCNAAALGALRTNAGALERCDGSAWGAVGAGAVSDRIVSTSANIVVGNGGTISFTTGGVSGTAYFDTVGRLVVPGISTTGAISGTDGAFAAVTVSGVSITPGGVDDVPNAFDFTNVVSASAGASVSSNIITLSGLGTVPVMAVTAGISSTRISVDGGALVRQAVVMGGQTVQAWVSASVVNNSSTVSFINIGSVSDTWAVMTASSVTIVSAGSFRRWSDGTVATTCNAYRAPTGNYSYSGTTGDGIYRIDPDGAGAGAPFDADCDMTNDGGGWTLVAVGQNISTSLMSPGNAAVNTVVSRTQLTHARLAFSVWNQIGNTTRWRSSGGSSYFTRHGANAITTSGWVYTYAAEPIPTCSLTATGSYVSGRQFHIGDCYALTGNPSAYQWDGNGLGNFTGFWMNAIGATAWVKNY